MTAPATICFRRTIEVRARNIWGGSMAEIRRGGQRYSSTCTYDWQAPVERVVRRAFPAGTLTDDGYTVWSHGTPRRSEQWDCTDYSWKVVLIDLILVEKGGAE